MAVQLAALLKQSFPNASFSEFSEKKLFGVCKQQVLKDHTARLLYQRLASQASNDQKFKKLKKRKTPMPRPCFSNVSGKRGLPRTFSREYSDSFQGWSFNKTPLNNFLRKVFICLVSFYCFTGFVAASFEDQLFVQ